MAQAAQRLTFERDKHHNETIMKNEELDKKDKAENDEIKLLKRYGDALAQVLSPQPDEVTDLPAYFRGIEEQFEKLKIPSKFRARLIFKYLSTRARSLCSRLEPEVRDDYDKMKKAVMKEYGLTAKCFLERFNTLRKPFNDTYILFTSKLRGLLLQYFNARKVSSFDDVVSLLVADRVKSSLTEQCLKYILSVENNLPAGEKQWLKPERLAEVVDEFVSYTSQSGTRASYVGQLVMAEGRHQFFREHSKPTAVGKTGGFSRFDSFRRDGNKASSHGLTPVMNSFGRRCTICNSQYHLKAACDKVTEKGKWSAKQTNAATVRRDGATPAQGGMHSPGDQSAAQVNRVKLDSRSSSQSLYGASNIGQQSDDICASVKQTFDDVLKPLPACTDNCDADLVGIENLVSLFDECESPVNASRDYNNVNVTHVQLDMDRFIAHSNVSLHYVNLIVNDENGKSIQVDSLFDSGTQLSVIREDLIKPLQCEVLGEVKLLGFNGNMSTGKVISLHARMNDHDDTVPIRFVACQNVTQDCLLSLSDYHKLLQTQSIEVRSVNGRTQGNSDRGDNDGSRVHDAQCTDDMSRHVNTHDAEQKDNDLSRDTDESENVDVLPLDNFLNAANPSDMKTNELVDEQQTDVTLSGAFSFARQNKGGYFLKNGILFHRTKICDNLVERLVVPVGRRRALLELAHDKIGCHLGIRKTKERIGLSFMWPTMIKDVIDYCRSCEVCQRKAPITYRDRVPIEGGVVSIEPVFSHFYVDALGPLFNHKVEYNYCIVFLDHTSRFPHAVAVRNLTAKSCCDAMLSLFQFTGFPIKVTSDNAGNFTAELTREFLKRVGCSPIWCTPRHPEANSVERTIGTIKAMIAKVAQQYPHSWHRYIGLILFALRESVNETTGQSPYTLVYGRLPVGPLAVLKNMWVNEDDFPTPKNKSTAEFLKELRERLEVARSYANAHAESAQQRYVSRYNRRSRDKSFTIGEHVLVLQKDSTASKVFSRWIGPAVIYEVQSPYSYIVEFADGSRRILHANHLHKFHTRAQSLTYNISLFSSTNSCAIINDGDEEFGEICVPDLTEKNKQEVELPSQKIDRSTLAHLAPKQQQELLQLLDKYADRFSDIPGLTTQVEHCVELMPGFKPKRMRAYKVPERLQPEVERQLKEMLANGIIRESNSPMASPLVCVLKGKGGCDGVRLAVDYRYVNQFTVSDAFPIPEIEDVIQRIGGKRYISNFDCRAGYHQTGVREQDKWLTAFVCLGRLYEYNRTPFGMRNAGQTFVRAMQIILQPLKEFADSYVDDSAVHSNTWRFHLSHNEEFLKTMKNEGITLNLKKCRFAQHNVKFCGEIIGSGIRRPDPEKVAASHEMSDPETKRQLRGILGFFSYFRKYINAFAEKAKLLSDLTAKRVPQNIKSLWNQEHSKALEALKFDLIHACESQLHIIRMDQPFEIFIDASGYAVGGYLGQRDDVGVEHPIAFFSSK